MAARAVWSKAARRDLPPAAMPDAHDQVAGRRPSCGGCSDSLAFRIRSYWSRLCRNPIFRCRTPLEFLVMGPIEGRTQAVQLSFLCACGSRIVLKNLGCCRSCYDRRHHSLRFFGGLRERVLVRDRFRCRGCGKRSALVVHHRDDRNRTDLLVTLCIRCHIRIHHSSGLKHWFPEILMRLWREVHPNAPMQLQLSFRDAEKKNQSRRVLDYGHPGGMEVGVTARSP